MKEERGSTVISIDWTILVQFVNFIVLMVLLNILLFRPLRNIMAARQEAIEGGHQQARDLDASINEKLESYQAKLHQAKLEGSQAGQELRAEAAKEEMSIIGAARTEADASLTAMKKGVAIEVDKARVVLNKETQSLAKLIASKVLGRNVK